MTFNTKSWPETAKVAASPPSVPDTLAPSEPLTLPASINV